MNLPNRNKSKNLVTAIPPSPPSTQTSPSNDSNSDSIALRIILTTWQESLDRRELGLVAREEKIEGMDEG